MGLGRGRADRQLLGDLRVGHAAGDHLEHLELALGEHPLKPAAGRAGPAGPGRVSWVAGAGLLAGAEFLAGAGPGIRLGAGELADQAPGDARREQCLPGGHHPDGGEQVGGQRVLEQEAAGPGPQRREDVLVQVEGGQDERTDVAARGDPPGGLDAVHDRHPDVHQDDVGTGPPGRLHRLRAVARLADHGEAGRGRDDPAETHPDQCLVVGDHHPQGHAGTRHFPQAAGCAR